MAWGKKHLPSGIAEVTGCKHCSEVVMPENLAALIAANNVNTNFSYERNGDKVAAVKDNGKGGRSV